MTEATKALVESGVIGDMRYEIYDLTNAANDETVTTGLNEVFTCTGVNETTADKVWNCTRSANVVTCLINTTTDEYRITAIGR